MSAVSLSDSQSQDSLYLQQSLRKKRTLSNSSSQGLTVTDDNNNNINLFDIKSVTDDTHEQCKLPADEHGDRMDIHRCHLSCQWFYQNLPQTYGSPVARDLKNWTSPKRTSRWELAATLPRPLNFSEALEPMDNDDGASLRTEDKLIKRQRTLDLFTFEASTADDSWAKIMTPTSLCSSQSQQGTNEQDQTYSNDAPNMVSKSPHYSPRQHGSLSPTIGNTDTQLHFININKTYIKDGSKQDFGFDQESIDSIEQKKITSSPVNRPVDIDQAINQKMDDNRHIDTKSKLQQSADQLGCGKYPKGNIDDHHRLLEHDTVERQYRSKSDLPKRFVQQKDITETQNHCKPEQQLHSQLKDQQSSHHRHGMENHERQRAKKQTLSQLYTNLRHQRYQTQASGTFSEKADHHQQPSETAEDEEYHTRKCTTQTNEGDEMRIPQHAKQEQLRREIETLTESVETLRTHYRLLKKVGCGTFSSVYKALDILHSSYDNTAWKSTTTSNSPAIPVDSSGKEQVHNANAIPSNQANYVALKQIYSTSSPKRIAQEIKILKYLRGAPNVCQLITAFRSKDYVFLVMPYFKHYDFMEYFRDMDLMDTKYYMKALLTALQYLHGHRILHRDIKPNNFLYDKQQKTGILIDFGLAQMESDTKPPDPPKYNPSKSRSGTTLFRQRSFISPSTTTLRSLALKSANDLDKSDSKKAGYIKNDQRKPIRASNTGTRGFRAPEVLLRVTHQTIAIDIWAVGVILLSLLTGRFPFFIAHDEGDSLIEIASIFGMAEMKDCAALHNRTFETNIETIPATRKSLSKICKVLNTKKFKLWAEDDQQNVENAIDLVEKLLTLNCKARITAEDALKHPFLSDTLS